LGICSGRWTVDFVKPDTDVLQMAEKAGSFSEIKAIGGPLNPFFCDIINLKGHHNWSNNEHTNPRMTFPIRPFFSWMKRTAMFVVRRSIFEKPER
jgi:hypothetical protein